MRDSAKVVLNLFKVLGCPVCQVDFLQGGGCLQGNPYYALSSYNEYKSDDMEVADFLPSDFEPEDEIGRQLRAYISENIAMKCHNHDIGNIKFFVVFIFTFSLQALCLAYTATRAGQKIQEVGTNIVWDALQLIGQVDVHLSEV